MIFFSSKKAFCCYSAQSEYILELTRVVAADYLMDVSHRTSTSNSADQSKMASGDVTENSVVEASRTDEDEALSRDILKRQQKRMYYVL